MVYNFDVENVTKELIEWIRCWFIENGDGCNAVIGISGGKDSTVVAVLCVEALGAERVIGVMMPCGVQILFPKEQKVKINLVYQLPNPPQTKTIRLKKTKTHL